MGKKAQAKMARKAVQSLPVIMKDSHENHVETGWQMIARGQTEINGEKIEPMKIYNNPMPISMAINHGRRLKKLIQKYGTEIIPSYLAAMQQSTQK